MQIAKKQKQHSPILYNGQPIPIVDSAKFLEINIDNKLTLSKHHASIIKNARRKTTQLYRLAGSSYTPMAKHQTTIKTYKTMIRSTMTYAAPATINMRNKQLLDMESTQRRAIRIAHHLKFDHPSKDLPNFESITTIGEQLKKLQDRFLARCCDKEHHLHNFIKNQLKHPRSLADTPLEFADNDIKEVFLAD